MRSSAHRSAPRTANCWQIPQDGSRLLREARHQALSRTCWPLGHRSPPALSLRSPAGSSIKISYRGCSSQTQTQQDFRYRDVHFKFKPRIIVCVKKVSVGSCFSEAFPSSVEIFRSSLFVKMSTLCSNVTNLAVSDPIKYYGTPLDLPTRF